MTAALLAVSVSTLELAAGFVANAAVTPVGRPVAVRVTLPVKPPKSVTINVSVTPVVCGMVTDVAAGERLKPAPMPETVTVPEFVD